MNVLDTVQKLLNLTASRGATAAEAAAAAAAAQRLVEKHRLSADDEAGHSSPVTDVRWFRDAPVLEHACEPALWRVRLLMRIANLNDCHVIRTWDRRVERAKYTLVGSGSDVAIVRHLCAYVEGSIERLVRRLGPDIDGVWLNNYRFGIIEAVEKRLLSAKLEAGTRSQAALVRHNARREHVRAVAMKATDNSAFCVADAGPLNIQGRSAGASDGRTIPLERAP